MIISRFCVALAVLGLGACTVGESEDEHATAGASIQSTDRLSGCNGQASTSIPSSGHYVLTSFGGGADDQPMSCGGYADGEGWYAASRQRYGCGAHIKIEANNKCVVVETDDYGPDKCVETAAGSPIIDASPRVSEALFGESSAGWSDGFEVTVTEVSETTPLGVCGTSSGGGSGSGSGSGSGGSGDSGNDGDTSTCSSATLDRDMPAGTCVQSASDGDWYICANGAWVSHAANSACTSEYGWCDSATLDESVPPRTCVQSSSSHTWFQCNGQNWVTPVDTSDRSGPIGDCSSWHAL